MIGNVLDKYEVLKKVGEGGMASVYLARHLTLGRIVAIKVLHPHLSASTRNRKRFAREARAIEHLDHDNILKIYDYSGVDVEDCYIVTEYVEGLTLTQLLEARGVLPSEVTTLIGLRLADALQYAHEAGIVHRDIKPENIMIRDDGTIKLMDFGIARFLDESTVTMTGALVGSPAYMSPEQALEKPVDARSDIFSFGAVLYQLCTGKLPFAGSNPSVILRNIIEGSHSEVLEVNPGVAPRLADLIERMLMTSPDQRISSAAEARDTLREALAESSIEEADPAWSLVAYVRDPAEYEARLTAHLDVALLARGRAAFAAGDHLSAQRLLNRLLVSDPNHPEVLALLSSLHQPETPRDVHKPRSMRYVFGAVAFLLVAGLAWLELRPVAPPPVEPLREAPIEVVQVPEAEPEVIEVPDEEVSLVDPGEQQDLRALPSGSRKESKASRPAGTLVTAPPELPSQPEPPPAAAKLTVRLTGAAWADAYLDGEPAGKLRQPLSLSLSPGVHKLRLTNPYAQDYVTTVDVASGEAKELVITLVKKPLTVTFLKGIEGGCAVRVDGAPMGTVASLGRNFELQEPDLVHTIDLECPDGTRAKYPVENRQPGGLVLLPPDGS